MELLAANGGANWHPLTSLITFDSTAEGRVRYFLPILGDNPADLSTLLHEMTHLMSARYGRLGIFLSRTAAIHYQMWKQNPSTKLTLSDAESKMIAAFIPFLEGLALYSQLDFEADERDGLHYSPLYLVGGMAKMAPFASGRSLRDIFSISRSLASGGNKTTLVRTLFLDQNREDLNYYLWGYLYIKTVQAVWARRCPALKEPANFLPLAIKFIAEHPVLEKFDSAEMTVEGIIDAVHETLIQQQKVDLDYILELFGRQRDREFDRCDIYAQLLSHPREKICVFDNDALEASFLRDLDTPTITWFNRLRACSWTYLYTWAAGELQQGSHDFSWTVTDTNGKVEAVIPPSMQLWNESLNKKILATIDPVLKNIYISCGRDLKKMEREFFERLEAHKGQQVCIAGFWALFGSMPGIALWVNNTFETVALLDPFQMADVVLNNEMKECGYYLGLGLSISPADRKAFASAFNAPSLLSEMTISSGEYLLRYLSSDPKKRQQLRGRLYIPWRHHLKEAFAWASVSIVTSPLREEMLELADKLFDFPGFEGDLPSKTISFRDLLPDPYQFIKNFKYGKK